MISITKYLVYVVLSALTIYSNAVFSDVLISEFTEENRPAAFFITGIIRDEDAELFAKVVSVYEKPSFIKLDSEGGSIDAAIKIGKIIRTYQDSPPIVMVDNKCKSSCVLILAGGLSRVVHESDNIGVHRPFLPEDKNTTIDRQKGEYKRIEKMVKNYLSEVNVPTSLYDLMFRIPPEKIHYLTEKELEEFNLKGDDPYYEEANNAKKAKELGISKLEYLKMKKEWDEKCDIYIDMYQISACTNEIKEKYRKK